MFDRRHFLRLTAASALAVASKPLHAQGWPNRPVHFVVGFAAGGSNDVVARIIGESLAKQLGAPFVIENRVGAGGILAAQTVINSPPDGYTIMFVAPNNAIGATLYKNLPYVYLRDAAPLAGIVRLFNVMLVPPSLPVSTITEFINYAKANPGKLIYASSGNGTSVHMSAELFKMMAKLDMVHAPYRGSSAAYPDLLTGRVHVMFDSLPSSIEFIRTGKLRALGVTTRERAKLLPEVPAIGEIVKGYEATVWYGIAGPKGMPSGIVEKLNKAVATALADPKIEARFVELGGTPMPMSSAEFGKLVADETEKWAVVVKSAGLSIE